MIDPDQICATLKLDPLAAGLQIVDAAELAREYFPRLDTDRPALIAGAATTRIAQRVRRTLRVNYPAAHPVHIVNRRRVVESTLGGFTRAGKFSRSTILYLPPLPELSSPQSVAGIVARLRAPRGCPWDRLQTHASLRRALIEETYEVIEAIDEGDPAKLQEELGDLLLHVLFQTQIAREHNEFSAAQVGAELAAKLIRRHPHVFGDERAHSAEQVLANWEKIKRTEKARRGENADPPALDAGIPRDLPALARAQKVADRAQRQGVGLASETSLNAVMEALARGDADEQTLGDGLWALARHAQEQGLDAESALRAATARFVQKK